MRIDFELCCLVVGEFISSLQYSAERCVLNGKVRVMLTMVCSHPSVQSRDGPREGAYLGYIIRAVLSWDLCLRGLSGWWQSFLGEWLGPGEDSCSMTSRMLNQGLGLVLAPFIIKHYCEVLAIWLRTRLS